MVFIFGGLLFILHHIFTKNISTATTHLDQLNADFLRREEEVKKLQAEAQNYYDDMIARAKEEAEKIRNESEALLQAEKERVLEETRLASEQIVEKAEKTKHMLTNELRREIEAQVTSRICAVMQNIFPPHIQEKIHKLWLDDLMDSSLSQLSQLRVPAEENQARIVSAFALTSLERQVLLKKFKDQLGRDFEFKEEVDPALLGGVLLTIGSLVLDGTVANRILQKIAENA